MTVEELINHLGKFPRNYRVMAFQEGIETDDVAHDIVDVCEVPFSKEVLLELENL